MDFKSKSSKQEDRALKMCPEDSRSVSELVQCFKAGSRPKYVFFWGHTKSRGEVNQSCLSQWYSSPFVKDGMLFPTAEHFMMYSKAILFNDEEAASRILSAASPGAAKALGRGVQNFTQDVWISKRFEIVVEASYLKFSQNPEIGEYLRSTTKRVLVEASPKDKIWGIGLSRDANGADDPCHWKGLNLLGFALMEARSSL
ncbi:MAG: NADAR family protein [Phormidesmis sp.]